MGQRIVIGLFRANSALSPAQAIAVQTQVNLPEVHLAA